MSDLGVSAVDGDGHWTAIEEAAVRVLRAVQPTLASERKRAAVVAYVQRLLGFSLGCQVIQYGSVPLKTYLPDGDIDLTVLANPTMEEALMSDIYDVLKREESNVHADFEVKAVQLIAAEVKIVKCLILDIVVDISCNQLGGLCTLCFLEQIDRVIEKGHLFKRSIILIKAWCFYESRILGATHGLFSTYALEVLVLYIFHVHHKSLKGPASVLYKFLDYYSKFDWDNYCVSLDGPVCKPSLPDITATPEIAIDGLLLSNQFLANSNSMFKPPPINLGKEPRPFQKKFINIIDPLKDDNNLGRSVNQGNFFRIRSALKYGARKLGEILSSPTESTRKEMDRFFVHTLVTHVRRNQASPHSSESSYSSSFQSSDVDSSFGVRSATGEIEGTSDSSSQASDISSNHADRAYQSGHSLDNPLESTTLEGTPYDNGLLNSSSSNEVAANKCGEADSARMFGELKGSDIIREPMGPTRAVSNSVPLSTHYGDHLLHAATSGPTWNAARFSPQHQSLTLVDRNEISEPVDPYSGLAGDYESHLRSLFYGQCFHGTPTTLPMFFNVPVWDTHNQINFGQDHNFQMNPNYPLFGQLFRQGRGTGTYIPRTYLPRTDPESWGEEGLLARKVRKRKPKNPAFQSYHHDRNFDQGIIPVQANVTEQIYRQEKLVESRQSTADPSPLYAASNPSNKLEFSSAKNLAEEKDKVNERVSDDSIESESHPILPISPAAPIPDQKLPNTEESQERVTKLPYQLKDEVDFPPLAPRMTMRRSASA